MIVTCPSCAARYKLDDGKVTGRGAKITCPKCRYVFVVYPNDEQPEAEEPARPKAAPAPEPSSGGASAVVSPARRGGKPSAEALDFRTVGIASWKVRVKIGLVYDFSDIKTLRKYIQDGRVTSDDVISHNGQAWVTIGDIPDLDAYFIKIYEDAQLRKATGGKASGFEEEDAPTMIVGMGSLGNDLAADALRQATATIAPATNPNPAQYEDANQFVDPFAALKSKQRDRVQQRRTAATPAAPPPKEEGGVSNRSLLAALVVFIGLGAAVWYLSRDPVAPPPPNPAVQPGQAVKPPPTEPTPEEQAAKAREEYQRMVEESLKQAPDPEPIEPENTEPTLIPVGPRGGIPPQGSQQASATGVDHAAQCLDYCRTSNWQQATDSCRQGARGSSDPQLTACYGFALYNTGQASTAQQQLKTAERSGYSNPLVKKLLGHIARDQGDVAGALGYYQQYLSTNPPDRGAIEAEIAKLTGT